MRKSASRDFLGSPEVVSAVLAIAEPRRIKATHRRRRKITSGPIVQRYYDPIVGRFLSSDPVSTDTNTGGNFNRYWYANDNPFRFTDPDGRAPGGCGDGVCKGLFVGGPKAFRQKIAQQHLRIKSAGGETARRLTAMQNSSHAHRVYPIERTPRKDRPTEPVTTDETGTPGDDRNGKGTNSQTYINPDQSFQPLGSKQGTPDGVLVHEELSHGYDRMMGTNESHRDADGHPSEEVRANEVERQWIKDRDTKAGDQ